MKGCEDVKMRSVDVKVCKCEMKRCEDDKMTRVDVKMYGCDDGKNR